ncbi:MAG: hypothetical protein R3F47_08850 [Gammaproteobacteria bacterium]
MAFDYGSIGLGIKNPFRLEGVVIATRGALQTLLSIYLLVSVSSLIDQSFKLGWITAVIGFILLSNGLYALGRGIFKIVRFYVGRSIPTSLAKNVSRSEKQNTEKHVHYSHQQLEEMLMGRKNVTYKEPVGLISRMVHSFFPRLTFTPFPVRNIADQLAGALAKTAVALLCYVLSWFMVKSGLVGKNAEMVLTGVSFALLVYLILAWRKATVNLSDVNISRYKGEMSVKNITIALVVAILTPVIFVFVHKTIWLPYISKIKQLDQLAVLMETHFIGFSSGWFILGLLVLAALVCAVIFLLVAERAKLANPVTEVSEFRESWQELVHPQDIFINIESSVMANRRYREVPNRVYRDFDANLLQEGRASDKGQFDGETIQETQPEFVPWEYPAHFKLLRMIATIGAQVMLFFAYLLLFFAINPLNEFLSGPALDFFKNITNTRAVEELAPFVNSGLVLLKLALGFLLLSIFGRLLENYAHTFWAEIQFKSLMVFFRVQGTFTESKVSTGMSIYDSTRSENVVVRSSMTPWVICANLYSSTFAMSGVDNLEHARLVWGFEKNDDELKAMIGEVKEFLRQREAVASLQNEKELNAISKIAQVNQQTRAVMPDDDSTRRLDNPAAAAGFLRQQEGNDRSDTPGSDKEE